MFFVSVHSKGFTLVVLTYSPPDGHVVLVDVDCEGEILGGAFGGCRRILHCSLDLRCDARQIQKSGSKLPHSKA
jgi:hypothetical protein